MKNLITKLFIAVTLVFSFSLSQPVNSNGSFEEGVTPGQKTGSEIPGWTLFALGNASATFEIVDQPVKDGQYALKVTINTLGANAWDIQAVNEPITLKPGSTYKYSCYASADVIGPIVSFTVGLSGAKGYGECCRVHMVALTDEWQLIEKEFVAPANADNEMRAPIHFNYNENSSYVGVGIYIDKLEIVEVSTGMGNEKLQIKEYSLAQNYPNPFNPTTTIEFTLPERSNVKLVVSNMLGQIVEEIVNKDYPAGKHQVKFDAKNLASGIYFYKMTAGKFNDVKKLIVIK